MFERKKIRELNDFFIDLNSRREKGVFFYRIHGYNEQIGEFIQRYYDTARLSGVIIEGNIPNPDEKNLSYYSEIMGMDFQMSLGFITAGLKKWLPRMNDYQRNNVAASIYDTLESLRKKGKNENMLKNAYIKFMCWLYYRFERIVNQLGENAIPKILYEGNISNYELMLVSILSNAGCDVVLLQYAGNEEYLRIDPGSEFSDELCMDHMEKFPESFNLKWIRSEVQRKLDNERLYGVKPSVTNCTNAWIEGKGLDDIKTNLQNRGNDPGLFYNCFCRINGVEDKLTYLNELYQFQLELKNSGRKIVIVDKQIPQPSMEEINSIRRGNYAKTQQMLLDLANNIKYTSNIELQRIMNKVFIDIMLEEAQQKQLTLNKLLNKAVYLLCWLSRYQKDLFSCWKMPDVGCFIYLGGCKNDNEALFVRMLARLPVDVLILNPNLNEKCLMQDNLLYEINYVNSLVVNKFPQEDAQVHIGTAAYHAERELDTIMYQDSGMYRNRQYKEAKVINLQTMYEEIAILWNQEVKYRPNFSTVDEVVNLPVIFAKVSGIKEGDLSSYWSGIKQLVIEDTLLIKNGPYINATDVNPVKAHATEFFKNGRLQKSKIKEHQSYQYGVLREEIQDYILEKLQLLINQKKIKGTFENGTEYTIISTALNMPKEIVRMIQKFDFTRKNPKIVYIKTSESILTLEDSILLALLNLIGFDIVFFVPTGYQNVEKHFNVKLMEEHQIGDYIYDLQIPDFDKISLNNTRQSWRKKLFKRGI